MLSRVAIVICCAALFLLSFWSLVFRYDAATLSTVVRSSMPPEELAFYTQTIDLLRSRDFDSLVKRTDPKIVDGSFRDSLGKVADLFSDKEKDLKAIFWTRTKQVGGTTASTRFRFEYELPDKWLLVDAILAEGDGTMLLQGLHVQPLSDPVERIQQFNLFGQTPAHYLALACGLLIFCLDAYALATCILTTRAWWKWAWVVFIFVGFGAFTYNWNTGAAYLDPMTIGVPVVQFNKGPFDPLTIKMMIPLGAIIFLSQRRRRPKAAAKPALRGGAAPAEPGA